MMLSTDWSKLWVHGVVKTLGLIFVIVVIVYTGMMVKTVRWVL